MSTPFIAYPDLIESLLSQEKSQALDGLAQAGFHHREVAYCVLVKFLSILQQKNSSRAFCQAFLNKILQPIERERVLRDLESLCENSPGNDLLLDERLADLLLLLDSSPYASTLLNRFPQWWNFLKTKGFSHHVALPADFQTKFSEFSKENEREHYPAKNLLRRFKAREFLLIGFRDLLGQNDFEGTIKEISTLADFVAGAALAISQTCVQEKFGHPKNRAKGFFLLAMGKLGGLELNFSSDVDIIALHRSDEGEILSADATSPILTPNEYYTRLTEVWVKTLSEVTSEGFIYRVDLRLRPEGSRGPLVNSVQSAQNYYEIWGTIWERAAYLKARPLAGDKKLAIEFLHSLEPFVYRRHLDFRVLEEMQNMKRLIEREEEHVYGSERNLKLGRGGIREIEFFVQILQLLHGGREYSLRSGNTLTVLRNLESLRLIPTKDIQDLCDAYVFLRRTENLLQFYDNQQSYQLPTDEKRLRQLARALQYDNTESFLMVLKGHRHRVRSLFEDLLREKPPKSHVSNSMALNQRAQEILSLLHQGYGGTGISEDIFSELKNTAITLGAALEKLPEWRRYLKPLEDLFRKIGKRIYFYQNLTADPGALDRLLAVFSTSDFLTETLLNHIQLLEDLNPRSPIMDRETMAHHLKESLQNASDRGEVMDRLRDFRHRMQFRIGLADLFEGLKTFEVQNHLTELAETCLEQGAALVHLELTQRYGIPRAASGEESICSIVELGTFGACELNYTSDLDIIFVYSHPGETDGKKSISNHEFFTFLAQRLISFLTLPTQRGIAYAIDTRLRPSGNAGALVTSHEAFLRYHREKSQIWEIQSLLRTKLLHPQLSAQNPLEKSLRTLVFKDRTFEDLATALHAMRKKVQLERGKSSGDEVDLKLGEGGLMDIEFVTQYLQLKHKGPFEPHTRKALEELTQRKFLDSQNSQILIAAYDRYRHLASRLCLVCNRNIDQIHPSLPRLDEIARTLAANDAKSLIEQLRETMAQVRKIYLDILGISE